MGVEIFASIDASGENFSPKSWEKSANIVCTQKTEVGEIKTRGRYKDKPSPLGIGIYKFSSGEPDSAVCAGDEAFWKRILCIVETARQLGADDIDLSMTVFYKGQCNFDFNTTSLAGIHRLGIPLLISCVEDRG
jgi:hypothetical protein